jgi:hypothetical protein
VKPSSMMGCGHGWSDADLSIAEPVEAVTFRTPPRRVGNSGVRTRDDMMAITSWCSDVKSGRTVQVRLTESPWYNQIAVRVGH